MKEYKYKINGNTYKVAVGDIDNGIAQVEVNGTPYKVELEKKETVKIELDVLKKSTNLMVKEQRRKLLKAMEEQMIEYADCLDFESAAIIRDEIQAIKNAYEK